MVVRDVHTAGFPHLEAEEMYFKKIVQTPVLPYEC